VIITRLAETRAIVRMIASFARAPRPAAPPRRR
jgi:hypothetical protein